ncbi:uncharacterized protein NEMAJ01_1458 [Nematocida major]|uniref:uncharacterized protein n=1 Tax=Nematocida major TaxID=1912982 RepID=UPI002007FB94|nr:uncharacterized protein NEMAJ01_1458 [Nematocida major]KAH9386562.1 hypothetical protein NEMAJ01_1458 [Nematocida major]
MNRTEEYRRNVLDGGISQKSVEAPDGSVNSVLSIAKELRNSLSACHAALVNRHTHDYSDVESTVKELVAGGSKAVDMMEAMEESKYLEGVAHNIRALMKRTEMKLEERKSRRVRPSLNIALEPEKSTSTAKTTPVQMQVLHEENERILERVRCTERELVQVRRRVSEIDVLQKLITQELYVQDERIDVILSNTTTASIDVKISRTYIRNAQEKRQAAKRFISLFVMILSIVLLFLHHSNKSSK